MLARAGVVGLLLSLLLAANASAATRTWDGGCGAETAWSCAANWSENTVPGAEDTALLNGTSTGNSVVDAGFAGAVADLSISSGYTGTVSLSRSLTVSNTFTQTSGSFNGGGQKLTVRTLTLNKGSFTAPDIIHLSGALKIAAVVGFNANGGTLELNGAGASLSCGGATFSSVTFTNTTGTKTVNSNCTLPLGKDPEAGLGGSINLNGTLVGEGTLTTTGTLTLNVSGALSGFNGLSARNLTEQGADDFGAYSPFEVDGSFILPTGASFKAPSGTASFGKNFTVAPESTFDANEGTVVFDGTTTFKVSCGGTEFDSVGFESSGHKTIASDCALPLGEDPSLGTAGGTTLNGSISGSGTLTQIGTFEIDSASPGLDSFTDVFDNGSFLVFPGAVVTAPSGTLTVQGNFTIDSAATFDANEGTVDFQALPKTTKTITCGEAKFNLVTFTNTSKEVIGGSCTLPLGANPEIGEGGQIVLNGELTGSGFITAETLRLTLGPSGILAGFSAIHDVGDLLVEGFYDFGTYTPLSVLGDLTITETGEVVAPTASIKLFGDFIDNGTFDANKGTVLLLGMEQALVGSTTFNNLARAEAGAGALIFEAGMTQTVEGALTLAGAGPEELLSLISSKSGEAWNLAGSGSRSAKWLSVKDSNNTGTEIAAVESVDAGGNAGWSF